jgi:hypothetical protein
MHVRIEDAGQHRFPSGVKNVLGPSGKIVAKSDDLAVGNADVRFDHSHARNDESSAFNDEGILRSSRCAHPMPPMPGNR